MVFDVVVVNVLCLEKVDDGGGGGCVDGFYVSVLMGGS